MLSTIEINKEKSLFQVFFLKDNKDQSVEVKEIEEIDFREIENRLKQKESVFITYKRKQKLKTGVISREDTSDPWYFTHI